MKQSTKTERLERVNLLVKTIALGYLVQFERLIEKSEKGTITTAELAYMAEKFDPAELYDYEQQRNLSITLLKQWLVRYKFKNWNETETSKTPVTTEMKEERAVEIAERLNQTEIWHTHGRGISMEVLKRDLGLRIEDFGQDEKLSRGIREYDKLLSDYMARNSQPGVVHAGLIHASRLLLRARP